jgi:hypothetical protein
MSDADRGTYAPLPEEPTYDVDDQQEAYGRGPFLLVVAMIVLIAFLGVVYVAYQQGVRQGQQMNPPLIVAEPGPVRMEPEDPGGFEEPYQDTFVLNGEETEGVIETVLPPPEEPLERPVLAEEMETALLTETPDPAPEVAEVLDIQGPPSLTELAEAVVEEPLIAEEPEIVVPLPDEELDIAAVTEIVIPDVALPEVLEPAEPALPVETAVIETPVVEVPEPAPDPIADLMATGSTPTVIDEPVPAPRAEPDVAMVMPPSDPASTGISATSGSFVIQVASVPSQQQAQSKQSEVQTQHEAVLIGLGFDIQEALVSGGTYYRLRIGPFDTRPQAVDLCETLKARGQDCYVTTP